MKRIKLEKEMRFIMFSNKDSSIEDIAKKISKFVHNNYRRRKYETF